MPKREKHKLFLQFEQWGYDEKGWAKNTRRAYRLRAIAADAWIEEEFGFSLLYAKTKHLRTYLVSTPSTPRNRNHVRQALIGFWDFLVAIGLADENLARPLPVLPVQRSIPKSLDQRHAERIVRAAIALGPEVEALTMLFSHTGLRRTEVRTLQWRMLELDLGWVRFVGKRSKERELPLHPDLVRCLRRWRAVCADPVWVFPSPLPQKAGPFSSTHLANLMHQVQRLAGVEFHPHMLRHTFATLLLEAGVDLPTLSEMLGHANIQTTTIYLRIRPARLQQAMGKLPCLRPTPQPRVLADTGGTRDPGPPP